MGLAEDSHKVSRIVEGSASQLQHMYDQARLMDLFSDIGLKCNGPGAPLQRSHTHEHQLRLLRKLPWVRPRNCSAPAGYSLTS